MSTLTTFRDHARKVANTGHGPDCPARPALQWQHPAPRCNGCIPEPDRALFKLMADEIDTYLGTPTTSTDLFGEPATEPQPEPTPEPA